MSAAWDLGFSSDLKKKLREIAFAVGVGLLRWLLEYLLENGSDELGDGSKSK